MFRGASVRSTRRRIACAPRAGTERTHSSGNEVVRSHHSGRTKRTKSLLAGKAEGYRKTLKKRKARSKQVQLVSQQFVPRAPVDGCKSGTNEKPGARLRDFAASTATGSA